MMFLPNLVIAASFLSLAASTEVPCIGCDTANQASQVQQDENLNQPTTASAKKEIPSEIAKESDSDQPKITGLQQDGTEKLKVPETENESVDESQNESVDELQNESFDELQNEQDSQDLAESAAERETLDEKVSEMQDAFFGLMASSLRRRSGHSSTLRSWSVNTRRISIPSNIRSRVPSAIRRRSSNLRFWGGSIRRVSVSPSLTRRRSTSGFRRVNIRRISTPSTVRRRSSTSGFWRGSIRRGSIRRVSVSPSLMRRRSTSGFRRVNIRRISTPSTVRRRSATSGFLGGSIRRVSVSPSLMRRRSTSGLRRVNIRRISTPFTTRRRSSTSGFWGGSIRRVSVSPSLTRRRSTLGFRRVNIGIPLKRSTTTGSSEYIPNGCSVPLGLPAPFVRTFTPACNNHDRCYYYRQHPRSTCDTIFFSNMIAICRETARSSILGRISLAPCFSSAASYYAATRTGGASHYGPSG